MKDEAKVSENVNAFQRLSALRKEVYSTAKRMGHTDSYSDLAVVAKGGKVLSQIQFLPDGIELTKDVSNRAISKDRLSHLKLLANDDKYSDFFVDYGDGHPWHEAFPDVISGRGDDIFRHMESLSVVNEYFKLRGL